MRLNSVLERRSALLCCARLSVVLAFGGCAGSAASPRQQGDAENSSRTHLYLAGYAQHRRQADVCADGQTKAVPVKGPFVRIVDPATARSCTVEVPGLGGDSTYWLALRDDRIVYWGSDGDAVYSTDLAFEGPAVKLGDARASSFRTFIPAADPDRVWLIDGGGDGIHSVQEVTADGDVTVPPVAPPKGANPSFALNAGLVFPSEDGDRVWNPKTGETILKLPQLSFAAHGDLLAWCSSPADGFRITDAGSGTERTIPPPPGLGQFECGPGAFSPDGSKLAVAMVEPGFHPGAPWQFALVDLQSDSATLIPGSVGGTRPGPGYVDIAWAPSGDAVYIGEGDGGVLDLRGGMFEYRLGADESLPVRIGKPDFMRMIAG